MTSDQTERRERLIGDLLRNKPHLHADEVITEAEALEKWMGGGMPRSGGTPGMADLKGAIERIPRDEAFDDRLKQAAGPSSCGPHDRCDRCGLEWSHHALNCARGDARESPARLAAEQAALALGYPNNGWAGQTAPKLPRWAVTTVWRHNEGQVMYTDILDAGTRQEAIGAAFEKRFSGGLLAMAAAVDVDAPEPSANTAEDPGKDAYVEAA